MKSIKNHLDESDMTYWYHCKHGIINGFKLLAGAIASFIHSIFPFLLPRYSIITVLSLYHEIKRRQHIQKIEKQYLDECTKEN